MASEPKTLQEAILYFDNPANCREYLVARRWPDGVVCPRCGSTKVVFMEKYNRWQCSVAHDARQFTSKTGTIFEDSPISLDKWLLAMWQVVNCKNGISSYEIHRAIGVTQKTAWFMDHRIRLALGLGPGPKFTGEIEADETFIGGKARNMHAAKRARRITGTGGNDKTAVMGILERGKDGSKVRTTVIPNRKKSALQTEVRKHVEVGSALYTDALKSYDGLDDFEHGVIDHAVAYVDGKVHTNGLENVWSLLKRGISGTYVSVEPFHLFRYLDEQAYRYNNRKLSDADRFSIAVAGIVGKRVTYETLIVKVTAADRNGCDTTQWTGPWPQTQVAGVCYDPVGIRQRRTEF
jgi:transposase-like protein